MEYVMKDIIFDTVASLQSAADHFRKEFAVRRRISGMRREAFRPVDNSYLSQLALGTVGIDTDDAIRTAIANGKYSASQLANTSAANIHRTVRS